MADPTECEHPLAITGGGAGWAGQGQDGEAHRDGRGGQGCVTIPPFTADMEVQGMDGIESSPFVSLDRWDGSTLSRPPPLEHKNTMNQHTKGVVKLDTNGAFSEVKIIGIADVGKQLQED